MVGWFIDVARHIRDRRQNMLRLCITLQALYDRTVQEYSMGAHCHCCKLYSYLFWSDGMGTSAKIERSDLSGNNRKVLVSSAQGLVSPTTLAVDFNAQKLYWLDADAATIGRVNFDGSELFTKKMSSLSQVSAMTVYSVRTRYSNLYFLV